MKAFSIFCLLLFWPILGRAESVKDDFKQAGHNIHEAARNTGHAFKKGGKKVGHSVHQGVKDVGHGLKDTGHKIHEDLKH